MKKVILFILLGMAADVSFVKAQQSAAFSKEVALAGQPKVNVYHNSNTSTIEAKVDILTPGNYVLEVYNLLGQRQYIIHNGYLDKGKFSFSSSTQFWPNGIYLVKLTNGRNTTIKKIVVQKP